MQIPVTSVVALVDWDNVVSHRVSTPMDAELAVNEAMGVCVGPIMAACPSIENLELRLYGSWLWRNGRQTRFGVLISSAANTAATRVGSVYVTASTVTGLALEQSIANGPALTPYLSPTRCRCIHREEVNEQKLADTMIVADAIYYANFADYGIAVISDDIDMSPGLMMASHVRIQNAWHPTSDVLWLRPQADRLSTERRFSMHFGIL
jgi:hypothetical protein